MENLRHRLRGTRHFLPPAKELGSDNIGSVLDVPKGIAEARRPGTPWADLQSQVKRFKLV